MYPCACLYVRLRVSTRVLCVISLAIHVCMSGVDVYISVCVCLLNNYKCIMTELPSVFQICVLPGISN